MYYVGIHGINKYYKSSNYYAMRILLHYKYMGYTNFFLNDENCIIFHVISDIYPRGEYEILMCKNVIFYWRYIIIVSCRG